MRPHTSLVLLCLLYNNPGTSLEVQPRKIGGILTNIPWIGKKATEKIPKVLTFNLYTRNNVENPEVYTVTEPSTPISLKNFNPKHKTKILVHGWMGSLTATVSKLIKNTYLEVGDYNVIVFDWAKEARKFYNTAKSAVPKMAAVLASFIDSLVKNYKLKIADLHLIGHSLGAHVSGLAGYKTITGTIGRITGLDPALPLFGKNIHERLSNLSANFVDVIHTCGLFLGMQDKIGHADFYPNSGKKNQPGCGQDVLGKCSHRRSYYYFAESIKHPNRFLAVKCLSWRNFIKRDCSPENVLMGESCPTSAVGKFYLVTSNKEPYGKGLDSIKVPHNYVDPDQIPLNTHIGMLYK